jgi:hypothetical protein
MAGNTAGTTSCRRLPCPDRLPTRLGMDRVSPGRAYVAALPRRLLFLLTVYRAR